MKAANYPHLFQPLKIGPIEVRNRLYITPHLLGYGLPDPQLPGFRMPSERQAYYFAERARGGVGLIIVEASITHPTAQGSVCSAIFAEHIIPALTRIADTVHEHGAKLFIQLWHGGHSSDPRWEPGGPRAPMLSSSDTPSVGTGSIPREMTKQEIRDVVAGFAQSTRNAKAAGYDGVEIHASHAYLVEQFLSPFYNKRSDEYGGSLENRMRLLMELLEAVRDAAGPEMAVGVRLNCDELLPGGLTQDDAKEIVRLLDASEKVDFLDLDIGTHHTISLMIASSFIPKLPAEEYIANVRSAVRQAVVLGCPGRLTDPADAERLVTEGKMHMVGAARAFIADSELAGKAERGLAHEIRPCIACNHCIEAVLQGGEGRCAINPATGREQEWGMATFTTAPHPKRVMIVGGGPAGMEAARVAALRGHEVWLYERKPYLGGGLNLMAAMPGRDVVSRMVEWYERQLEKLGVRVSRGIEVTPELVEQKQADATIVATGARFDPTGATGFLTWPIPGWDQDFVYTPEQALEDGFSATGNVVILDEEGQSTAPGVAELLAADGAQVELVSRWQMIAPRLQANLQLPLVMARLYAADVTLSPNTYLKDIGDHMVTLFHVFTSQERVVDDVGAVVLVGSRKSENVLAKQLSRGVGEFHVIGDAAAPRGLLEATYEGHRLARQL
jgi:dimethylamine/trimethylamine dehydrogenase